MRFEDLASRILDGLVDRIKLVTPAHSQKAEALGPAAEDMFRRITGSTENLGAQDGRRALNYFLVQHPGLLILFRRTPRSSLRG